MGVGWLRLCSELLSELARLARTILRKSYLYFLSKNIVSCNFLSLPFSCSGVNLSVCAFAFLQNSAFVRALVIASADISKSRRKERSEGT